jgi:hypothetical protein
LQFHKKKQQKILSVEIKSLPLHPQIRLNGFAML